MLLGQWAKSEYGPVAITLLAAVLFVCGAWWFQHIFVPVAVPPSLVGPNDNAMELLLTGATLNEIQTAVKRSGKEVDDIRYLDGTLLFYAVNEGRMDVTEWLLSEDANPNGTNISYGGVPLIAAIVEHNVEIAARLLAAGADPDLRMGGDTPRQYARHKGASAILAAMTADSNRNNTEGGQEQ